jgi:murein DD-endopeptidase MepM/ murein hydrolase activator NlpD
MSSARRTPRYVERIQPNIQIVGPTVEAQVIPIRRVTPAYTPVIDAPAAAPHRRPARTVPVGRRPWQVLVVSSTPGAATRSMTVARWQARLAVCSLAVMVVLASGAVVALVAAVQNPDLVVTSVEAAALRERLLSVEDSLSSLRVELAAATGSVGDSLSEVTDAAEIPDPTRPAAGSRRPTTPGARSPERGAAAASDGGVLLAPRSLDGLPVIGVIASGFSRSRRHPVLHIRRPHLGLDVAAPRGTPVTAPAGGKVIFVGRRFGYGLVVELDHGQGVRTRYAHLREALVHVGNELTAGVEIATVGSSGITTGPHLHYEVLVNGQQVDPLRYRLPHAPAVEGALSTTPPAVVSPAGGAGAAGTGAAPPAGTVPAPVTGAHDAGGAMPTSSMPR